MVIGGLQRGTREKKNPTQNKITHTKQSSLDSCVHFDDLDPPPPLTVGLEHQRLLFALCQCCSSEEFSNAEVDSNKYTGINDHNHHRDASNTPPS